jgi:hypothetical protein
LRFFFGGSFGTPSRSTGDVTFEDFDSKVNPDNFQGLAAYAGASLGGLGGGKSIAKIKLGSALAVLGGPVDGVDIGVASQLGVSKVRKGRIEPCECGK